MKPTIEAQIASLKTEISRRIKEAVQLEAEAQRLALSHPGKSVDADARAVATHRLIPRLKSGLTQLVAQKITADTAAAESAIDADVARRLAERAKDFPSLQERVYEFARAFNPLMKHADFPRLLKGRGFLDPGSLRELVEGMPALLAEWKAADRAALENEAKEAKAEARKRITGDGEDLLADDEQPQAAEGKAS